MLGISRNHENAIAVMFPEDEMLLILSKGVDGKHSAIHFEKNDPSFVFVDFMKVSDEAICAVYELYENKRLHHKDQFDKAVDEARSRFAKIAILK
jgi:hypothetical protein